MSTTHQPMSAAFDLAGHIRRAHEKHKRRRAAVPYANDAIPAHMILVLPKGLLEVDGTWDNEAEKRVKMQVFSQFAKEKGAVGMIVSSDMYMLESRSAARYFGLDEPTPENVNRVMKELMAIRGERYGGLIKNMPPECRFEGVVTAMIGPYIEPQAMSTQYTEGPRGEVRWLVERDGVDNPNVRSFAFMLKPWWDGAKEACCP